jgi:phage terminase large subunit-like protein
MVRTTPPDWAVRTEADRRALAAGYYWDQEQADRVITFAETYLAPKFVAGEFRLFEWQKRTLMSLYGWRSPDGSRRWRKALLHVPKKNGKTLLVAVVAAYELLGGVAVSPWVVSASTTKDNAKQVYEHLAECFRKHPKLKKVTKATESKKLIQDRRPGGGKYESLSSDAPNAEGANASMAIVDEAHAHQSAKLYQTLEYAMIGRPDGFLFIISTAGDDVTHWYYSLVERGRAIVAGEDTDPTIYAEIYEADPEKDDLDDPATWKKANPSLDLYPGYTTEKFRLDWESAKKKTLDRLNFERYRLNIFRKAAENTWIEIPRWDACKGPVPDAELRQLPCYLGFDASQRIDPTSLSAVWVRPGRKFYVRSWAWVAEAGVREREKTNLPRYQQFIADGSMVMTPGEIIDKNAVMRHIDGLIAGHQVKALIMDPNGAWVIGPELDGRGFEVFRQPQTHRWFNGPTRELETAVTERRVTHDGNAWLRWCLHSVRLDEDRYRNVRPMKARSADHIDGAVALLMPFALADQAAAAPPPAPSVYESRGVEVFD